MDLTPIFDFGILNGVAVAKCRFCGGSHTIGKIVGAKEKDSADKAAFSVTVDFVFDLTEVAICSAKNGTKRGIINFLTSEE